MSQRKPGETDSTYALRTACEGIPFADRAGFIGNLIAKLHWHPPDVDWSVCYV